jgi:hypothetical protein
MLSRFDKEKTKKNIALILDKVRTEADPQLLNEYRALFKGEVSLFRRSWTAAYLLMLYDQGGLSRFEKKQGRKPGGHDRGPEKPGRFQDRRAAEKAPAGEASRNNAPRRPPLADEDSKRIFISIGRNRRVFPREILGLINAKAAVSREDIGAIRILDNYSFIQVRDSAADAIIEALNGQTFRGRVLSVNYARVRKDGGEESREPDMADAVSAIHETGGGDVPEPDEPDRFPSDWETGGGDAPEPDEPDRFPSDWETGGAGDFDAGENGGEETGFGETPETEASEQDEDHADEKSV